MVLKISLRALLATAMLATALPDFGWQITADAPRFEGFRVSERYAKPTSRPKLITQQDREYRTILREAAAKKPNFAGRYIVTTFGCGANCVMGAVLDAETGQVTWFPFTICCWSLSTGEDFEPVRYRLDSRLIVFEGSRNEKGNGTYYYEFIHHQFVPVREIEQSAKR